MLFFCFSFAKVYDSIEFQGLTRLSVFSAKEILGFTNLDDISEKDVSNSIKRLFLQGYFLDIGAYDENGSLVYKFVEKPVVESIKFADISEDLANKNYKPLLDLKVGDAFDDYKLDEFRQRVLKLLRAQGFYSSSVEFDTKKTDQKVSVTVQIQKGKNITIYTSTFLGLNSFDKEEVSKALANKEKQSFSWFFGRSDGKLNLLALGLDGERLKNFYLQNGYLDASVKRPILTADFNNFSADILYEITEGKTYKVTSVEAKLTKDIGVDLSLVEFSQKTDKLFNIDKIKKDIETLKSAVGSKGYAFARIYPDIQKDTKNHTAKIIYIIEPQNKVYINDVIISGNERTLDKVIRREIFLKPGDLYNEDELLESKKALARLGYFSSTNIQEKRLSEDSLDLIITVKETSTGTLKLGGGWSSLDGLAFSLSVSDRNIFGSGIDIGTEATKTSNSHKFSVYFRNPRLNDSDYSLSSNVYNNYDKTDDYKTQSVGLGVRFGKYLDRYWLATLNVNFDQSSNLYYKFSQEKKDRYYYEGKLLKLGITPFLSFDTRDDYFFPRSGSVFTFYIENVGLLFDQKYNKFYTRLNHYYGLLEDFDYDLITRLKVVGEYMQGDFKNSKETPLSSRIYLGGIGSIRGFSYASLSPLDTEKYETTKDKDDIVRTGSNMAIYGSLEASFPLIESAKMRFAGFFDFGATGLDKLDIVRGSYGGAIEWHSPMGALSFVWALPIYKQELDKTNLFEFTFGNTF